MPYLTDADGNRYYVRDADYRQHGREAERMIREARAKSGADDKTGAREKVIAQLDATEADPAFPDFELDPALLASLDESEAEFRREHPDLGRLFDDSPPKPRCGARTRAEGNPPCRAPAVKGSKRCRRHGGLSTGATSEAGKARVDEARRMRWERHRKAKAAQAGADPDSHQ